MVYEVLPCSEGGYGLGKFGCVAGRELVENEEKMVEAAVVEGEELFWLI